MLIIWDRLFGTFQEKLPNQEIIYGLVVSARKFNPIYLHVMIIDSLIFAFNNLSFFKIIFFFLFKDFLHESND